MKKFFLLAGVLFFSAGCINTASHDNYQAIQIVPTESGRQTSTPESAQLKQSKKPVEDNKQSQQNEVENQVMVSVSQKVQGSDEKEFSVGEGTNALGLLEMSHKIQTKNYGSGLGEMVLGIDGVNSDSKNFWEFFVNGKSSNLGASSYKIKNNDVLEWKLSIINSGE